MPTRVIDMPDGLSRVETGPTRFGDDCTGLFVRGDDAFGVAHDIKSLVDWYKNLPESDKTRAIELGLPRLPLFSLNHYAALIFEEVIEK